MKKLRGGFHREPFDFGGSSREVYREGNVRKSEGRKTTPSGVDTWKKLK